MHASNLFSSSASIVWLSGRDKISEYQIPATRHAKSFCAVCGAAVPSIQMEGALLVVPAGCLDGEIGIRPTAHICLASRAHWEDSLSGIPKHDDLPA